MPFLKAVNEGKGIMPSTPEQPNEKPEIQNNETVSNLQRDVQQGPQVDFSNLNNVFAGDKDSAASVLGNVTISGDQRSGAVKDQTDTADTKDIASMTTEELETAMTENQTAVDQQRAYVTGIESRIAQVTKADQAGGLKQQADKLAEADAYFASGLS